MATLAPTSSNQSKSVWKLLIDLPIEGSWLRSLGGKSLAYFMMLGTYEITYIQDMTVRDNLGGNVGSNIREGFAGVTGEDIVHNLLDNRAYLDEAYSLSVS